MPTVPYYTTFTPATRRADLESYNILRPYTTRIGKVNAILQLQPFSQLQVDTSPSLNGGTFIIYRYNLINRAILPTNFAFVFKPLTIPSIESSNIILAVSFLDDNNNVVRYVLSDEQRIELNFPLYDGETIIVENGAAYLECWVRY